MSFSRRGRTLFLSVISALALVFSPSPGRATYAISSQPTQIVQASTPAPGTTTVFAPGIRSSTHPDPTKWYANSNPVFSWDLPADVQEVRLVLTRNQKAVPQIKYSPPITQKELATVADGTWYLNAQFRNAAGLSPVGSFRFNIDTQNPVLSLAVGPVTDPTNPHPKIILSGTDNGSGIDHYELQAVGNTWTILPKEAAGSLYTLPTLLPTTNHIRVRAFDMAGNSTEAALDINIVPLDSPVITSYPDKVNRGKPVSVSGTAKAGLRVFVYAIPNGSAIPSVQDINDKTNLVGQAIVDPAGRWSASVDLDQGSQVIYAVSGADSGGMSLPSNTADIRVSSPTLLAVAENFLGHLANGIRGTDASWFVASIAFYVLVALLLGRLLIPLIRRLWPSRRGKAGESKVSARLVLLLEDIEEEMALLDRIAKNRPLYPEERYLRSKLTQYRKTVKSILADTHSRLAKKK